jgi:mannose-6-phosphate isomerase-like protein (cupin superfamily)
MKRQWTMMASACLALTLAAVAPVVAKDAGKASVTSCTDLKWKDAGIPGVSASVVEGDMAAGPSRFYLKYAAGLVTPLHHHTPDHYVTTVSGTMVLVVDGKEHVLPAGSYFALTGGKAHVARVEGKEDCVMFIDAKGPWDVVPDK